MYKTASQQVDTENKGFYFIISPIYRTPPISVVCRQNIMVMKITSCTKTLLTGQTMVIFLLLLLWRSICKNVMRGWSKVKTSERFHINYTQRPNRLQRMWIWVLSQIFTLFLHELISCTYTCVVFMYCVGALREFLLRLFLFFLLSFC